MYDNGEALGKHLGMIGSPVHFSSERKRREIHGQISEYIEVQYAQPAESEGLHYILSYFDEQARKTKVTEIDPENIIGFLGGQGNSQEKKEN